MARCISDCTSVIFFVLVGLAACVMLAKTAPTAQRVHVRRATTSAVLLNNGVRYSVSYCRPFFFFKLPKVCIVRWKWLVQCMIYMGITIWYCELLNVG